jgi:hypothetical protein
MIRPLRISPRRGDFIQELPAVALISGECLDDGSWDASDPYNHPYTGDCMRGGMQGKYLKILEHRAGIEPANTGFADQRVSHFATGAREAGNRE